MPKKRASGEEIVAHFDSYPKAAGNAEKRVAVTAKYFKIKPETVKKHLRFWWPGKKYLKEFEQEERTRVRWDRPTNDLLEAMNRHGSVAKAAKAAGTRFIVVGGAAPLRLPEDPSHTVLTAPGFLPESSVPIATACQQQHDWVLPQLGELGSYLCSPAMLLPGTRTGSYRVGDDTLITDDDGNSHISMEDFAVAALDEVEHSNHTGRRFTVGD